MDKKAMPALALAGLFTFAAVTRHEENPYLPHTHESPLPVGPGPALGIYASATVMGSNSRLASLFDRHEPDIWE
jgi:hypothetical protein